MYVASDTFDTYATFKIRDHILSLYVCIVLSALMN